MRRNDVLLILSILLLGGLLFFFTSLTAQPAAVAGIYHAGNPVTELPLDHPTQYRWADANGFVEIAIEDGRVRVVDASCPDHQCMNMNAVSRTGASIICLPNRVSIILEDSEAENALDAVLH